MAKAWRTARQPADARASVSEVSERNFPDSPLRPQVEFAIARTYEQEQNWPAAIAGYQGWLNDFPTNAVAAAGGLRAGAGEFPGRKRERTRSRCSPILSRNFRPTNSRRWRNGGWPIIFSAAGRITWTRKEITNCVFQNCPTNGLAVSGAHDGRARGDGAAGLQRRHHNYFSQLEADTNCPMDLRVQATFAHGSALMQMDSTDTNNPLANFRLATNVFGQICPVVSDQRTRRAARGAKSATAICN